jgi:hypothetical protein
VKTKSVTIEQRADGGVIVKGFMPDGGDLIPERDCEGIQRYIWGALYGAKESTMDNPHKHGPGAGFVPVEGQRSGAHTRGSERRAAAKAVPVVTPTSGTLRIDLGCGPNPKEGFVGVDRIKFDKVTHVMEMGREPWPFADQSVSEAHCSHALEHLTPIERCHFFNELARVLTADGKATIIVPHWGSSRAYGDPTHEWPPMGEMFFYYLSRKWRAEQAPHTDKTHWPLGYDCDLEVTWGYALNPAFQPKAVAVQQFAAAHYREAIYDMQATVTKRKPAA